MLHHAVTRADIEYAYRVLAAVQQAALKRQIGLDLIREWTGASWGPPTLDDVRRAMTAATASSTSDLEAAMVLVEAMRSGQIRRLGRERLEWGGSLG